MTQEVHGRLNPELSWQKHLSTLFYQQIGLIFKEETSKVHIWSIVLCGG